MNSGRAIVVMGVSGCGKTSVAEGLAGSLGYSFLEGDQLHPQANIDKMSKGVPLTDADRWPWLERIGERLRDATASEQGIVVSCSALKRAYRDRLRSAAGSGLSFVFLSGSRALLLERMGERKGHFMPACLLDSQLAALEDPSGEPDVATVDIDASVADVIAASLTQLSVLAEKGR
ncbi:gluconate kinase (SKI family) [Rhizobium subbaraonis]|uniref:Gluconokinase n=1 Tax=Rhizobium subbaraonis TaxID=908946 RepID=A0A285UUI0_9HYPH|nr:gluconokinase [Rhizobium subbaraonis]SOC45453.1 gluconate kinase (SKI family) [Rhizobium subbaraonis]